MEGYEEEYQLLRHNNLHSNRKYYEARAKLSVLKYFDKILKDSEILDFGCGLGHNIYFLPNAVGYDISKFSLDFCEKKGIKVIDDIKKAKDESFDVVFSCHVLEHVENVFEVVKLMKSKLKTKGKLVLILPSSKNRIDNKFGLSKSQHLYDWNFRSLNNLLIKNGFKIVENKFLRGEGYKKLLGFSFNLKFYNFLTWLVGFLRRTREMKIVAIKE